MNVPGVSCIIGSMEPRENSGGETDLLRWIREAQQGDTRAFGRLIEQYTSMVTRMVVSQGCPPEDRGDVIQEIFIRAFRSLNRFEPDKRFDLWLSGISYRSIKEHWRRWYRRREIPESSFPPGESPLRDLEAFGSVDPADAFLRKEEAFRLVEALKELTRNQRLAVVWFYFEDMSVAEIAGSTGWSESKVKVTLHRGRQKLRKILADEI